MKNEVVTVDGSLWLVHRAESKEAAMSAINHARVRGSVGSKEIVVDSLGERVVAHVVRLPSPNDDIETAANIDCDTGRALDDQRSQFNHNVIR